MNSVKFGVYGKIRVARKMLSRKWATVLDID
jgi:hypothetical protein